MKVPVLIQHGERKVAASLVVICGRERSELMPTQHAPVLVDEGSTLVELSVQRWASLDASAGKVPALVHAPRDRALALHVNGGAPVEISAGHFARLELADEPIVIEITLGAFDARAALAGAPGATPEEAAPAPRRAARRRPGRVQVKPRRKAGRKAARKARR